MAFNVGLNVVEVDGAGAPAIVGAAVSVGAFNITTRRGVPNRPTRITSFQQFADQFGGFFAAGLGPYLVKGFFDNGGMTAYINRVVSSDATTGAAPASITLQDGGNKDTLTLKTGFRGTADPGAWGNDLFVKIDPSWSAASRILETAAATIQGTPLNATTDMSAFPKLSVRVDEEAAATDISFQASDFADPKKATSAEIRDAINRRTNKLVASLTNDNRLVLTSTGQVASLQKKGTRIQVTADNATLGFSNMANPTRGTLSVIVAGGTSLANTSDFEVGDVVLIDDTSRKATVKLTRINPLTGAVEWTPNVATPNTFNAALTTATNQEFKLTVAQGGTEDANVVETWDHLAMEADLPNYAPSVLNDTLRGSRYLMATDEHSTSGPGADIPKTLAFTRLNPGRDGTPTPNEFIGDSAKHTGLYAFDAYDVQLLCCERTDAAILNAALGYCAQRGDCMFVGSVPEGFTAGGQAVAYGQAFQGKKVYGALYAPWIKIFDPIGVGANPLKWIPPTGHVMGVYARVETARGIWKAPAGDEANLIGALDVEYRLSDAEHTDLVKNGSVNGVRVVPGAGIIVDASRTLSTDTRWLYVNVRLLFNYVKSSLKQGVRWVRQEPNRDTLWNAVKFNSVVPFLMGLWRQGAFGTGTPEQVFTVICDASNNPPEEVDKGNFKLEVYFYPSKPAETIIIIVGQQPSGATTSEA
ncbi:MAG: phage tail sheath subtilisin-like domain-containing protein [Chloroflexi bacterium]|nr:phage tail sheath subtilisin-like domain-containing protein [Chloroflexota bacterium]